MHIVCLTLKNNILFYLKEKNIKQQSTNYYIGIKQSGFGSITRLWKINLVQFV